MRRTCTFRKDEFEKLRRHLLRDDSKEHVAFLIFGKSVVYRDPWTDEEEIRLLCRQIDYVSDSDLIENNDYRIKWDTNRFLPILRAAEEKNFSVGLIHSHPGGFESFSDIDDFNERELFRLSFNRNGIENVHSSFIMTPPGNIKGRIWDPSLEAKEIDFIRILGERFEFQFHRSSEFRSPEFLNRQKLAFGEALVEELSRLRIGIVGCGATGTATAHLLARLGIGHLLLIDKDVVEESNLNRLQGATRSDVGGLKAQVLKKDLEEIGLGTKVFALNDWVSSVNVRSALKACDIVFGCTDDNAGRMFLNRFAYFFLIPLIDMGISIHLSSDIPPAIQALVGRVTVVFPGVRCLNSYGITSPEVAYAENLRRNDPQKYERLKKEAYVIGEGNPNPAVGTFTSETASIAVNEFLHRIQGYRTTGSIDHRLRLFHLDQDLTPSSEPETECRICGNVGYWGRGDMDPFLDMA